MDRQTLKNLLGEQISREGELKKPLKLLISLIDQYPNDMQLGEKVRTLRSNIEEILN